MILLIKLTGFSFSFEGKEIAGILFLGDSDNMLYYSSG